MISDMRLPCPFASCERPATDWEPCIRCSEQPVMQVPEVVLEPVDPPKAKVVGPTERVPASELVAGDVIVAPLMWPDGTVRDQGATFTLVSVDDDDGLIKCASSGEVAGQATIFFVRPETMFVRKHRATAPDADAVCIEDTDRETERT